MRPTTLLVVSLFATVSMAGCMDLLGESYEPRTVQITLEVGAAQNIPLYTLNDGESTMDVVAVGFTAPGQDALRVPNPEIRLKEGDTLVLTVVNNNPLAHTFHLHGGLVPWGMDGVPYLNQLPIEQGGEFTYTFEDLKPGTYMYHCHVDVAHHMDLGMYGAFIVEEVDPEYDADDEFVLLLDEWDNCHVHGNTDPLTGSEQDGEFSERGDCLQRVAKDNLAQNQAAGGSTDPLCAEDPPEPLYSDLGCGGGNAPPQQQEREWYPVTHPIYNPEYNTYLINGKAFPDTTPLSVEEGETVRIRLINAGEEVHAMHLHGHNMLVTHRDGYALDSPFRVDTLSIAPGERYDVIVSTDNPGLWAFHDHVGLHVQNDHHSPGGMFTCLAYDGFHGVDADAMTRSLDCVDEAMRILSG